MSIIRSPVVSACLLIIPTLFAPWFDSIMTTHPLICPHACFCSRKFWTYARTNCIILPSRCLKCQEQSKVIIQKEKDHLYPRPSNDRLVPSLMLLDLDLDEDAFEAEREVECWEGSVDCWEGGTWRISALWACSVAAALRTCTHDWLRCRQWHLIHLGLSNLRPCVDNATNESDYDSWYTSESDRCREENKAADCDW